MTRGYRLVRDNVSSNHNDRLRSEGGGSTKNDSFILFSRTMEIPDTISKGLDLDES